VIAGRVRRAFISLDDHGRCHKSVLSSSWCRGLTHMTRPRTKGHRSLKRSVAPGGGIGGCDDRRVLWPNRTVDPCPRSLRNPRSPTPFARLRLLLAQLMGRQVDAELSTKGMFHGVHHRHGGKEPHHAIKLPQSAKKLCRKGLRHVVTFNAEARRSSRCVMDVDGDESLQHAEAKKPESAPRSRITSRAVATTPAYALLTATLGSRRRAPTITPTTLPSDF